MLREAWASRCGAAASEAWSHGGDGVAELLEQIQAHVFRRRARIKHYFADYDRLHSGRCTASQFARALNNVMPDMRPSDVATLADHFSEGAVRAIKPQVVNYAKFCAVIDEVFGMTHLESKPTAQVPLPGSGLPRKALFRQRHLQDEDAVWQLLYRIAGLSASRRVDFDGCFSENRGNLSHTQLSRPSSASMMRRSGKVTVDYFLKRFPFPSCFSEGDLELLLQRYTADDGLVHLRDLEADLKVCGKELQAWQQPQSAPSVRPEQSSAGPVVSAARKQLCSWQSARAERQADSTCSAEEPEWAEEAGVSDAAGVLGAADGSDAGGEAADATIVRKEQIVGSLPPELLAPCGPASAAATRKWGGSSLAAQSPALCTTASPEPPPLEGTSGRTTLQRPRSAFGPGLDAAAVGARRLLPARPSSAVASRSQSAPRIGFQEVAVPQTVVAKVAAVVAKRRMRVFDWFRDFDKLCKGVCTQGQMQSALGGILGLELGFTEYDALFHFYENEDGKFKYRDFCADVSVSTSQPDDLAFRSAPSDMQDQTRLAGMLARISKRILMRRMEIRQTFKDFSGGRVCHVSQRAGHVTRSQFTRIMSMLGIHVGEAELQALCTAFCDSDDGREINFEAFCNAVDPPKAGQAPVPAVTSTFAPSRRSRSALSRPASASSLHL